MEIILLQDIEKVGDKHTIVNVKNGFGRNYLIPNGMALIANESNRKRLNELRRREAAQEAQMIGTYQEIANQLEGKTLRIGAKAGTSGKIFGSVTPLQVSGALKEQFGVEVPRRKIALPDDVKNLGAYEATLNLHVDVVTKLAFEVVAE